MTHQPTPAQDLPAPSGEPVTTHRSGLTSNFKNVTVRPWRQSTAVLAVVAQALFALGGVTNLYLAWLDVRIKGLLSDQDYEAVIRESETVDGLYLPILAVGAGAGIVFLVWFHRVWTSDRSDHGLYTRGTGLAIGGWFIPLANFVLGPLALRDLLWGTEHASPKAQPGRPVATPRLVIAWWVVVGLGVLFAMLGRGAETGLQQPKSLEALTTSLQATLTWDAAGGLAAAVGALVAVLTIRRVMDYTRR
ncbi:DUF4328 domain-containing protein [Terrabacter sp. GCM10028922]|uniref:DUF4328 domain-containing protein n=1 Tax=Terrabacter sp. GCM10028922 TaxID=3273428 RepID=UPI00361B63D5